MAMHFKAHVLTVVQSTKETWLDLSWAGFSIGQPNRMVGKPLAAFTAQSHPHPSICLGTRAPPPCQVLVSTFSLREQSHCSCGRRLMESRAYC